MTTTDVILEEGSDWTEITLTGSKMIISVKTASGIRVRFGASSTSSGFVVEGGSILVVEETIWVKDEYGNNSSVIAVSQ